MPELNTLSGQMARLAFGVLKRWTGASDDQRRKRHAAVRDLPLLIRRHGLRRTLHHWLAEGAKDANEHVAVARAFSTALAALVPGLPALAAGSPNTAHMVQTRLALALADQWLAMSEAMLEEPGGGDANEPAWAGGAPAAGRALTDCAASSRNGAFELYNTPYPANVPALVVSSESSARHFDRICEAAVDSNPATGPYALAFHRWNAGCRADGCKLRTFRFTHRILIGLSETNLWETGIAVDPVYGVPAIAGSAIKGLAIHFAMEQLTGADACMTDAIRDALFGTTRGGGVVDFMDAWWVPASAPKVPGEPLSVHRPFVREVVTPHHQDFLDRNSPSPATPFDKPVPVPQLAAHGSFLFAVNGPGVWADHALDIVELALQMQGLGARTPEYGQATSVPDGAGDPVAIAAQAGAA